MSSTKEVGVDRANDIGNSEHQHYEEDEIKSGTDSATVSFIKSPVTDVEDLGSSLSTKNGISKYRRGLKNAIPVRCVKTPKCLLPLESNGLFNYSTFGWLTPYMWQVFRSGIETIRAMRITTEESAQVSAQRMEKFWQEEVDAKGAENASYGKAIVKSFKTRLLIGAFISVIFGFLTLANPLLVIRYFLTYVTEEEVSVKTGIKYAILLGIVVLLRGIIEGFYWMLNFEAAARIKNGTLAMLYRKIVNVKNLKDKSIGDITNFITNDGQRIWDSIIMGPFIIGGPMILIGSLVASTIYLGPWALLGWLVIFGFYPFSMALAKKSQDLRGVCIKITDKRVGLMTELLTCIKLIKMYAWEKSFSKKVADIRGDERAVLEKSDILQSVAMGSSMLVPLFACCLTFVGYVGAGNNLTPTQAFTFVSLLNTVQFSMLTIPFALKSIADVMVTLERMKEILLLEEMKAHSGQVSNSSLAVEITDASFIWDSGRSKKQKPSLKEKDKPKKKGKSEEMQTLTEEAETATHIFTGSVLRNITCQIKRGHLVGVCGHVGCGKSSLVNAILGRMELTAGTVAVAGRIALVSQEAWITNDTIKENILFGSNYDPVRYKKVVDACALAEDFATFPSGDVTEAGERGSNLSGGQKQRISLARAGYSFCDIVFLDDPLSAVDVHVGRHIFDHCILDLMKGRTVVFVTHQLQYLQHCDEIVVMKDGSISEQGPHSELVARQGEYSTWLQLYLKGKQVKSQGETHAPGGSEDVQEGRDHNHTETETQMDGQTDREGENENHTEAEKQVDEPMPEEKKNQNHIDSIPENKVIEEKREVEAESHPHTESVLDESLPVHEDQEPVLLIPKTKNEIVSLHVEKGKEEKLIQEEEMEEGGSLTGSVVHQYIMSLGGYVVLIIVFICFALPVVGVTTAGWYLSHWMEQKAGGAMITVGNVTMPSWRVVDHPDLSTHLTIYGLFIPVLIVAMLLRSISLVKATLKASSTLHNLAFNRILGCPMSFFDSTPLGRIINRFSADLDELDTRLPMNLEIFLTNVLQIIAALAMIAYVSPWFLIAIVLLGALFFFILAVFHKAVRELKRLDNVTRSPVISHMGASLQGLSCIHAYQKKPEFVQKHCELLNTNLVSVFLFYAANRWLALRLDIVSALVMFVTGLLILLTYDHLNPPLAGLALSYAVQMSGLFQFTVRMAVETEARFTSVQRIEQYCNLESQESSAGSAPVKAPPSEWPQAGMVSFRQVSMRYWPGLPLALKGLNFQVESREKIGIVGRSGAGKTSLSNVLFRLTELEGGQIVIDDIDIANVDLTILRSRLSVIPQDPKLFSGSLRYNLDPLNQYSDADLWQSLDKCHIADLVRSLEQQLETNVTESGGNFSVGERQLFCMARALLRKSKILVLDEATAAIDAETDAVVQSALKDAFNHCTMLIIAHRLNTVIGCDRIMVMEDGNIKEFDSPANLRAKEDSMFKSMWEAAEAGERVADSES